MRSVKQVVWAGVLVIGIFAWGPARVWAQIAPPPPDPQAAKAEKPAPAVKDQPKDEPKVAADDRKLPETYRGLPLLWIPKLEVPANFQLTGDVAHGIWKQAARVLLAECTSGDWPALRTSARMFCTDKALYLGIKCEEPDLAGLVLDHDEMWMRDGLEIFFEPYKDTIKRMYHMLLVDAAGVNWTSRVHMYARLSHARIREEWTPAMDMKVAKTKDYWGAEIKLPFSEMRLSPETRAHKTLWRMNLYRRRPAHGNVAGWETQWAWSPTRNHYFHVASKFGYVLPEVFASEELIRQVKAEADKPVVAEAPPPLTDAQRASIDAAVKKLAAAKTRREKVAAIEILAALSEASPLALTAAADAAGKVAADKKDSDLQMLCYGLNPRAGRIEEGPDDELPTELLRQHRLDLVRNLPPAPEDKIPPPPPPPPEF